MVTKRDRLAEVIAEAQQFRMCGPSDDPDRQTQVTTGYRYLLVQLQRLASPLLPEALAARLNSLDVDVRDLYSAFTARAEVDALLPDIEAALAAAHESISIGSNLWIVARELISELAVSRNSSWDTRVLVRLCEEVNSSWAHGNVVATALVMRAALNYVPPVFGSDSFTQVLASSPRTLKDAWTHLEEGLRKVADYHTHRRMTHGDIYPSAAQVEPFRAPFESLMQEVARRLRAG